MMPLERTGAFTLACAAGLFCPGRSRIGVPGDTVRAPRPASCNDGNKHIEGDGDTIFRHACKLGLEGIVSKRKDSPYRSGRSPDWLKMKNPDAPAVRREAEEDWGAVTH